jgi:hypothetical protein
LGASRGLIGLAVGGAAGALAAIGLVVWLFHWLAQGDARQPAANNNTRQGELGAQGMIAPGTAELRAAGCAQAVVVDTAQLLGDATKVRPGEPRIMISCDVAADAAAPTCERAAAVYFAAIGGAAEGNVQVRVTRQGSTRPACSRLFAPSGADLGER